MHLGDKEAIGIIGFESNSANNDIATKLIAHYSEEHMRAVKFSLVTFPNHRGFVRCLSSDYSEWVRERVYRIIKDPKFAEQIDETGEKLKLSKDDYCKLLKS